MIKHIVFFKSDKENIIVLKEKLNNLPSAIREICMYETGINISDSKNAYDLCLVSEFKSLDDLEKYRIHPEHQKVVSFIMDNKIEVKVVDYEFN